MNNQMTAATFRACPAERLTVVERDILRLTGARFIVYAPDEEFVKLYKERPEWDPASQRWRSADGSPEDRVAKARARLFPSVWPGELLEIDGVGDG